MMIDCDIFKLKTSIYKSPILMLFKNTDSNFSRFTMY